MISKSMERRLIAQHAWSMSEDDDAIEIFIPAVVGRRIVASIAVGFQEPWESQQRAHAKLLFAAPKLLAALKAIMPTKEATAAWERPEIQVAQAAIELAEGSKT